MSASRFVRAMGVILAPPAVLLVSASAHAYAWDTCGGIPVKWDSTFQVVQNTCSIGQGGVREEAMMVGINRWRNVGAMVDMVSLSPFTNPLCSFNLDDGQNDVAVVTPVSIGFRNGLTMTYSDACIFPGDEDYHEADVMVSSAMIWGNPDEAILDPQVGQSTFVHEFGHAHGLNHFAGFNQMRESQPRPHIGGPGQHVDVLPDDANGGRALYPHLGSETNLFATAHRRNPSTDTILLNTSATFPVYACTSGAQITVDGTVGNNGTGNVTHTERWYVSNNVAAYGGLVAGWRINVTVNANATVTAQVTLTIPPLSVGTYHLFHKADAPGQVSESNESDNATREALIINVIQC